MQTHVTSIPHAAHAGQAANYGKAASQGHRKSINRHGFWPASLTRDIRLNQPKSYRSAIGRGQYHKRLTWDLICH